MPGADTETSAGIRIERRRDVFPQPGVDVALHAGNVAQMLPAVLHARRAASDEADRRLTELELIPAASWARLAA